MKPELAIIGYGRFGRCAGHYLKKWFRIVIADIANINQLEHGIHQCTIEEASQKKILILAVPINQLPSLLKRIAPLLRPRTLICDVCSVKEQPVQWMKKLLPKSVYVLGMHPLFGPDSSSKSFRGRNLILCPVRISPPYLRKIHTALTQHDLSVSVMSPDEHDRLMARTLFLTQYIGRGLARFPIPRRIRTTENFQLLATVIQTACNDTSELFHDMYRYNRFAKVVPHQVLRDFKKIMVSLPGKNR